MPSFYRSFTMVAAALLILVSASIPSRGVAAQKWAVLVGVDRYKRSDVTALQFAVADARSVAKALVANAGFPTDNVFLLTTDQTGDAEPTRSNLAFRLGWLAEHAQPGDTVFFFFSGHGMQMDETSYLLTCDADPRNSTTLKMTGFSRAEMQEQLKLLKARQLLVILDACRNDPRAGRGGGDNKLTSQMSRDLAIQGRPTVRASYTATVFACSEGERSYEWGDRGHGFFTYFLLQALSGKANDASGRLTLGRLKKYLKTEVPKATERVTGLQQVPKFFVYGSESSGVSEDDCVVTTVKPGRIAETESGPEPPPRRRPLSQPQSSPADAGPAEPPPSEPPPSEPPPRVAHSLPTHKPPEPEEGATRDIDPRLIGNWVTSWNFNQPQTYTFTMAVLPDFTLTHTCVAPAAFAKYLRTGHFTLCKEGRLRIEYTEGDMAGQIEETTYTFRDRNTLDWYSIPLKHMFRWTRTQ